MRPLTEEETKIVFEKLSHYIGRNIKYLLDRPDPHHFRLQKSSVYYVSEAVLRMATLVPRSSLASLGIMFGKITKTKKFRLQITCLPYLAQYAQYKIWVKPSAEMSFLYGNHVLKAHLHRITENTPQNQGVVIFSSNDLPLGFGVTAHSSTTVRNSVKSAIIAFNQSDLGFYLRSENDL